MIYLFAAALCWLLIGQTVTLLLVALMPDKFSTPTGQFAWHWASARVVAWPLVLLFFFFYVLSIPARLVWARQRQVTARHDEQAR
jgi:hypothetical protein